MVVDYTGQVSVGSNVSNEDLLHKQTRRFQVRFKFLAQMYLNSSANVMKRAQERDFLRLGHSYYAFCVGL